MCGRNAQCEFHNLKVYEPCVCHRNAQCEFHNLKVYESCVCHRNARCEFHNLKVYESCLCVIGTCSVSFTISRCMSPACVS